MRAVAARFLGEVVLAPDARMILSADTHVEDPGLLADCMASLHMALFQDADPDVREDAARWLSLIACTARSESIATQAGSAVHEALRSGRISTEIHDMLRDLDAEFPERSAQLRMAIVRLPARSESHAAARTSEFDADVDMHIP